MADRTLYQRMLAVANDAGSIIKDVQVTGPGGGYKGTSHDATVKAVREACVKHGVMVLPSVVDYEESEVTFKNGGTAYKITLSMDTTFVNAERPDERFTTRTVGIGVDTQDKGPGKAMSYAKKYALMMAFLMTTGDNDEERQHEDYTVSRRPAPARPASVPQPEPERPKLRVVQGAKTAAMTEEQGDRILDIMESHVFTPYEKTQYGTWARKPHSAINADAVIDRLTAMRDERLAAESAEPDAEWQEVAGEHGNLFN